MPRSYGKYKEKQSLVSSHQNINSIKQVFCYCYFFSHMFFEGGGEIKWHSSGKERSECLESMFRYIISGISDMYDRGTREFLITLKYTLFINRLPLYTW